MAKQKITESSGNVFADLGLADAKELDLKAELVLVLASIMGQRGLNQTAAALLTGISQPDLSRLLRGHLRDMSVDRLIRALTHLETEVDISFRHRGKPVGETIHLEAIPA
ncbi:MAG: helix-turn-helix domain-containing protein [Sphingomicrobium sp.]